MIRSVAIATLKQTSLRTSASYAANPHSRQKFFLLLKDLAEEKPSAEMRCALDQAHEGATTDRRLTPGIVAGLALVAPIVHLLTIHRYGYFRDELYYIACARHLDFGYVDLAPLSAFLLR